MKEPTYIMYSDAEPSQHSSTPPTPAANANHNAPFAFLSAAAPSTILKMAWPTIMTVAMRPPTTTTSNVASVRVLV